MDLYPPGRYPHSPHDKNTPARADNQTPDAFPVDRQDSLMLCQQLQEKDGVDFMDENMDLTPYLNDLQDLDGNDMGEEVMDKQRLIENDIRSQQIPYPLQYAELIPFDPKEAERVFEDVIAQPPSTPPLAGVAVKTEAPWEDEASTAGSYEQTPQPTTSTRGSKEQIEVSYTPTIKPRKYSLKPEAEKRNPAYRLKREKNNDAVRKSRTKAKEQQRMKDHQICELKEKMGLMNGLLADKESRIKTLERTVKEKLAENAALVVENRRLKSELKKRFISKC